MVGLALAALIPPLYLIRLVYKMDKIEKEPFSLIRKLFLFGVLSVIPTIVLELLADQVLMLVPAPMDVLIILENFLGVALMEEGMKFLFLKAGSWKHPAFNYRFDAVVYAVTVSLGFAAAENVMYVFENGMSTALVRAITSIPGHAIFGLYMGVHYGEAKCAQDEGNEFRMKQELRKAVIIPMLLHGFYDWSLSTDWEWMVFAFLIYIVLLDIISIRFIRKFAREDRKTDPYAPDVPVE